MSATTTRYDARLPQLESLIAVLGEPAYRARQVYEGLYLQRRPLGELTTLPKGLRARLEAALPLALTVDTMQLADDDTTAKWLWRAVDGAQIETVLMRYASRATVCVSSQAGCAMGCTFCATGQAGFERHLSAGEIVEQVVRAQHASPQRVSNVVFMGMGEPLANLDAVLDACRRLHRDIGLSARHLTVSTVGVVPGIERLTEFELPVTLAVSLHAPDDALREQLVPLNRRYPLAAVLDAARALRRTQGTAGLLRVRVHQRGQRSPASRRRARGPAHRFPRWRARQSHPPEQHGRLSRTPERRGPDRGFCRPVARGRAGSDGSPQSWHHDRRRVRPAPGPNHLIPCPGRRGALAISHNGIVNDTKWIDPHQPQTLYMAVILCYVQAVFTLLSFGYLGPLGLFILVGLGGGGFGIANEKKWGYAPRYRPRCSRWCCSWGTAGSGQSATSRC